MTETELVNAVLQLARKHKVLAHHCEDTRHCDGDPGFPDLVLVGENEIMFRECKSADGETTADQDRWLHRLSGLDNSMFEPPLQGVWRPADLENGRIERDIKLLG